MKSFQQFLESDVKLVKLTKFHKVDKQQDMVNNWEFDSDNQISKNAFLAKKILAKAKGLKTFGKVFKIRLAEVLHYINPTSTNGKKNDYADINVGVKIVNIVSNDVVLVEIMDFYIKTWRGESATLWLVVKDKMYRKSDAPAEYKNLFN